MTRQAPDGATAEVHAQAHRIYRHLYPTLRDTFVELGAPLFD
jgi:xylulokinase